jgi:anti-sigma B factor antagonist
MDLKLDHYRKDGFVIIEHEGEIDVYTAPRARELYIELVNRGEYRLILNLERVEFLDSTGLGVMVGCLKRVRAHDGSVYLVCTQERILKIFRITDLNLNFPIFDTVDEAVTTSPEVIQDRLKVLRRNWAARNRR